MNIIDCKQGTPEWLAARLGKVTASEIGALVSPLGKVRTGDGPRTYLYKKLAEKILGVPGSDFTSFGMEQGVIVESEARAWFAFENNVSVREVGFCESDDGHIGFSPDGLIGEDGGIEIKSPQPAKHIEYLLNGVVPEDILAEVVVIGPPNPMPIPSEPLAVTPFLTPITDAEFAANGGLKRNIVFHRLYFQR
jgi:hypothetical protein